jgi:hypothetical protein
MKSIMIKSIEIFTDGTVSFSHSCLKSISQVSFYEKDIRSSLFFKKLKKNEIFQNSSTITYKSKYKI